MYRLINQIWLLPKKIKQMMSTAFILIRIIKFQYRKQEQLLLNTHHNRFRFMIKFILPALLLVSTLSDCPLNPYPRRTATGSINCLFNNDIKLHGTPQQYSYPLDEPLLETGVNVVIGIYGFELSSNNQVDFSIEHLPSTILNALKFRAQVNDPYLGWRTLKFNFMATQSSLFQISMQVVTQFSGNPLTGVYSVYRPILNFNSFQIEPSIKIFMHGLVLKAKPLTEDFNKMAKQYQKFKKFSSNTKLVTYFSQALEDKKSLSFRIYETKLIGRMFTFSIETSTQLKSLRFTYLAFSRRVLSEKHSFIMGDFFLINGNQHKISSLQNMDMLLAGLAGFKAPRDQIYNFNLIFNNYLQQSSFEVTTNYRYFNLDFTYVAFQMQTKFVCDDCLNSPTIYDNKYCVQVCPRSYSRMLRLNNYYCEKCEIDRLKVVDMSTGNCVCAKRHYLDISQDMCQPCRYDCMTCSQAERCQTCDNEMLQTKRRLNANGRCECPSTGFYDDATSENIVCQKCDSKCLACNGPRPHDCLSCAPEKQLDPMGFCVCKNGFFQDEAGNCACNYPRILYYNFCLDTQLRCNQNQTQQFVQISRRCICKPGFIQVGDKCIKCGSNSVFDENQLRCKCNKQTVYVNDECVPCGLNQVYDQNAQICVCKPGTFKSDDGSCVTCPLKMTYLEGRCECIFNFFESRPGVCERCLRQTDGPKCRRNSF